MTYDLKYIRFKRYFSLMLILFSLMFLVPSHTNAGSCSSFALVTVPICTDVTGCSWVSNKCTGTYSCSSFTLMTNPACSSVTGCSWASNKCTDSASNQSSSNSSNSGYLGSSGIAKYIPDCTNINGQCSDVSIFLITAIGLGQYVFTIIGAIALVMFVYGGIIWITSNGNPEKVKQGMGIFMSAVIGLVIVFSAYMLVKYFGDNILNIGKDYRLK